MLVHPSLPSPTGIAWGLWSWVKPKIYDHLERSLNEEKDTTAATRHRSYFIVLLINIKDTELLDEPKVSSMPVSFCNRYMCNSAGIH